MGAVEETQVPGISVCHGGHWPVAAERVRGRLVKDVRDCITH